MISVKRATTIILEVDIEKRNKLVDELSEEDAKYLLKQYLTFFRGKTEPNFELDLK
jgi:hypothetical protein